MCIYIDWKAWVRGYWPGLPRVLLAPVFINVGFHSLSYSHGCQLSRSPDVRGVSDPPLPPPGISDPLSIQIYVPMTPWRDWLPPPPRAAKHVQVDVLIIRRLVLWVIHTDKCPIIVLYLYHLITCISTYCIFIWVDASCLFCIKRRIFPFWCILFCISDCSEFIFTPMSHSKNGVHRPQRMGGIDIPSRIRTSWWQVSITWWWW